MKRIKKETKILKELVIEALQDIKAEEIIELDLRNIEEAVSDHFIICHGTSNTQVGALSDSVFRKIKDELSLFPKSQEGKVSGNWIILDYFDVVVHIFHKEAREYYQLEELWNDAKTVEYK